MPEDIHVTIGQIRIGHEGHILRANLGSCVGIGLLWPHQKKCILAHCLLPVGKEIQPDMPAKYVNFVVPELLRQLDATSMHRNQLDVVVGGGGNMLSQAVNGKTIGDLNAQAAIDALRAHRLTPVHVDTGGASSRQIVIDCTHYTYSIRRIES